MPLTRLERSLRATFIGMATNAVLSAAKLAAGILGHSHALVADATESFADVFSSLVVWRGVVLAAAPADEDHPYGHGKAEPLAAAVVAVLLWLAAGWITIKAFGDVTTTPHPSPAPFTLVVLVVAVAAKEILFRFLWREGQALDNIVVRADARHHRTDAITSFAAAVGISLSLIGGPGYRAADDWAAMAAACVIAWNGWGLLRPALNELMDTAPDQKIRDQIRRLAETVGDVARVEKCFVRKMGYQFYVDMHVEVDPQMSVLRSHEIAHAVKDKIREAMPAVSDVLVHIEPLKVSADKNAPPAADLEP
ncbi:MAG: cation diffusion facilitator family transporter [Verrucomicrobiota bacterium]|jgi:cation diffusion facilitator family transporter